MFSSAVTPVRRVVELSSCVRNHAHFWQVVSVFEWWSITDVSKCVQVQSNWKCSWKHQTQGVFRWVPYPQGALMIPWMGRRLTCAVKPRLPRIPVTMWRVLRMTRWNALPLGRGKGGTRASARLSLEPQGLNETCYVEVVARGRGGYSLGRPLMWFQNCATKQ